MLLSMYGFSQFVSETSVRMDPARLAAQVISGIGFLGAGAILRNGNMIKGLTTAASIWVVAAIGLCVGAGFFTGALLSTFMVLFSLYLLNKWEKHLMWHRRLHEVEMKIIDHPGVLGRISSAFGEHGLQIANVRISQGDEEAGDEPKVPTMDICFSLTLSKQEKLLEALEAIAGMDIVIAMEANHFQVTKKINASGGSMSA
jgi:putative Mg2+ transporter-C (MgtC) family protein